MDLTRLSEFSELLQIQSKGDCNSCWPDLLRMLSSITLVDLEQGRSQKIRLTLLVSDPMESDHRNSSHWSLCQYLRSGFDRLTWSGYEAILVSDSFVCASLSGFDLTVEVAWLSVMLWFATSSNDSAWDGEAWCELHFLVSTSQGLAVASTIVLNSLSWCHVARGGWDLIISSPFSWYQKLLSGFSSLHRETRLVKGLTCVLITAQGEPC